jgi:hypothetical protein
VNLSTPVDFSAGAAHQSATVREGDARIEVLTPSLVRLEYSPSGQFQNDPTVNVLNRRFPVPDYTTQVTGGWLTLRTSSMTLRYRVGSGPFGPLNTTISYRDGRGTQTAHPTWDGECPFGQVCQAGAAALAGGAAIATNHTGYQSTAGFAANLGQASGASATWTVLGAPAGQAAVTIRYANAIGALGGPAPRTIDLGVNGGPAQTLTLPPTASWNDWSTVTATVPSRRGRTRSRWRARRATAATSTWTPSRSARPARPRPHCRVPGRWADGSAAMTITRTQAVPTAAATPARPRP